MRASRIVLLLVVLAGALDTLGDDGASHTVNADAADGDDASQESISRPFSEAMDTVAGAAETDGENGDGDGDGEEDEDQDEYMDDWTVPYFDEDNKMELLADTDHWFLYFYTPWCKTCIEKSEDILFEVSKKVYHEGDGKVHVGMINCTESPNFCGRFGMRSYPSFAMYHADTFAPYLGNREFEEMAHYALTKADGALFQALPPQSSIFLVWLEKMEAMVTTLRLYPDDDINSGLIGLLLGMALLLPPLLLYGATWVCLWVIDSTRTLPPAVPSQAQAKKDN